ncbi:MAG: DUF2065 domain-containing protein [Gammaproteobacteria bacterium]|nr:DUF2065 domain-containing protein [Gammaproteobacteria bacterium]MCY4211436.1 DUF2065 domain-containing protein [Gammaproteobacteria bacterium]MCY4281987.1 DUF2065 domain-containing protein [Gammaproteobacteria bacterium]MCY4339416.1 DUF2065 domain-containing protein [Gammaproteobacteria bacterium]
MWTELLSAIALVFILEGLMPFLHPNWIKRMFLAASQLDNNSLRFIGVSSMLLGVALLYLVR